MNRQTGRISSTLLIFWVLGFISGLLGCQSSVDGTNRGAPHSRHLLPTDIPKYKAPLVIPPVMPYKSKSATLTEYHIAARQFNQQVLPPGFPETTVWGYGVADDPMPGPGVQSTYNYPAFTIEARKDEKIRVKWTNGLVDAYGNYIPHLFAVDQTLHWANPPGPPDMEGMEISPYKGPVPLTMHLHGSHTQAISDGLPQSWFLPNADNIPAGYTMQGTDYASVITAGPGSAVFEYPNDQRAATLWYHDHALGVTRLNVYAGLAGFYLLRDDEEDALGLPGPAPQLYDLPGSKYYEIPIVIQDRSFFTDGSLFYPKNREFFDGFTGPFFPDSDIRPIWNPEFIADSMVVNGRTWPYLEVEPRLYRFRFMNGCNARTLILKMDEPGFNFTRIGAEGGLLADAPLIQDSLLMAPAERADVIVDFSSFAPGTEIVLLNLGPDEPYKGPNPPEPQVPADPQTTGQAMKFKVVAPTGWQSGSVPVSLPSIAPLITVLPPRDLTINELVYLPDDVPFEALLGTVADGPLEWGQAETEILNMDDTEIWRLINLTEDAHPIHLHMVMFQVLDRTPFDAGTFILDQEAWLAGTGPLPVIENYFTGPAVPRQPWETGWKDTVVANPGEVTRIIATFDIPGTFVWHCHILEHEDNEMMRKYTVQ